MDQNPTLALTYKDDGNQDGICSQLLRIYGIYAISRFLRIPYVHSPIAHLGYQGLKALENNAPLPGLLGEVNRAFQIPSDIDLPANPVVHEMNDADVDAIERIRNAGSNGRELHLIRILYPFPVTDRNPDVYRFLKQVSPFPYRRSDVFRLAVHVRRGECLAVSQHWMLPNSYYVSCVLRFQDILRKLDIPFVCELYTEVPSKAFVVTPQHHGINGRIAENMVFDPAMSHPEEFDAIPNLEKFINFDPIESIGRMTTADGLIISHSSFSYFPAILNSNRIVVYHPYWRSPMKHWLVADEAGGFSEGRLIERLQAWKRSAAAAAVPVDLDQGMERLLQPFGRQSAKIRSVVAMTEEATSIRLVGDKDEVGPATRVHPNGTAGFTLASLALQARELSGSSPGADLLVSSEHVLNEIMKSPAEEFSFGAAAVLFPGASGGPGYEENWKLRRSLFDRGLICIGAADFAGGRALCFLASDAIRSFNELNVESRGHVTMSTLTAGAGFGNQLWRYVCVKLYALRHGLTPAFPAWQGNQLFGLEDESCENFSFPKIGYPGFADNDRELWDRDDPPINIDLAGYFQEIPECWRRHREFLRNMFQLSPQHAQAIEAWRDAVTDGGRRTLVAVSVRRGDYSKFQFESFPWFRIVPEGWYLDWLRTIWPTLRDPVLFVASDEPEKTTPVFQEFQPLPAAFGQAAEGLPHHVTDFEVLRRADSVAICNSSFPRFAAILAPSSQECFLPSFQTQSFLPYQPWMDPAFWPRFADAWGRTNLGVIPELPARGESAELPAIFFEISDLLVSSLPQTGLTGIQQFQWEILRNVCDVARSKPVQFVVLNQGGGLATIQPRAVLDLFDRMQTGAISKPEFESSVLELRYHAVPCTVRPRDIFLTLGAFWNVSGMTPLLQNLKNRGAIAGVFFHNVTPIAAPEFVEPISSRRFSKGVTGALTFADFILTSSEYTKTFLSNFLGSTKHSVPARVVRLGHRFSLPAPVESRISDGVAGILGTSYVLCAGTIEARSNPAYLFSIWRMMLSSGRPDVPYLVFAGRKGFLIQDFLRQLDACNYLDRRIRVVQDPTAAELDSLYRNCMLTYLPSFFEEWGLQVGESLAHGKICISSTAGGIPEAGGQLVDYVDPYNVRDGLERLSRYLDNPELRGQRELEIAEHFRPRSWRQAAEDLLSEVQILAPRVKPFEGVSAVQLSPGRYVAISSEGTAIDKGDGRQSPELLCVSGWFPPEVSGVRPSRPRAIVRFCTAEPIGSRINVILRLAVSGSDFHLQVYSGCGIEKEISIAEGPNRVAVFDAVVEPGKLVTIHLVTIGSKLDGDRLAGDAYWMLKGILYFASVPVSGGEGGIRTLGRVFDPTTV